MRPGKIYDVFFFAASRFFERERLGFLGTHAPRVLVWESNFYLKKVSLQVRHAGRVRPQASYRLAMVNRNC